MLKLKVSALMAQNNLKDIQRIEKNRNIVHEKVHATYTVFQSDGEKYVQLDTYGRTGRENPEKLSQSIQLDSETASFLVDILRHEFNID